MMKRITGFCMGAVMTVAGCASTQPEAKEPEASGSLTLAAGPCAGFCPEYVMRVEADDRYRLTAGANTVKPGKLKGALPAGTFRKALRVLERHGASTMQMRYGPDEPDFCPRTITGSPILEVARRDGEARTLISYDTGCIGFTDKDRLDQMIAELKQVLRINELIVVGE